MRAAGRRQNKQQQQKAHGTGLHLGNFFGARGSPIVTKKTEAMEISTKQPTCGTTTDSCSSSSDSESPSTAVRIAHRRRAIEKKTAEDQPPMSHYTSAKNGGTGQMNLDNAKKAKIPLYLKSPMFAAKPIASVAAIPSQKVLPARAATQNQNIDFNEITLGRGIGEGAFGKVYEGKWKGIKAVAIKMLICQDLSPEILEEFESEVRIMSVLRHPNICRLLGACMEPPNRCLVVELLNRGSLWGVLRTNRRDIDTKTRFGFVNDTAKGMSYLHNFHPPILHRDLKSPNLLVDSSYNIKISDFGLARVKARVQTMTGNCGTVQWMAPEVLANQKYTEKADVFSFGIVVWEIVTGECPYDGMTQIQAALGVLNRNLRPAIPRSCPPFLQSLMKACWARQPEARPSFVQIVKALRDYKE